MVLVLNATTRRLAAVFTGVFFYAFCICFGLYALRNNPVFRRDGLGPFEIFCVVPMVGAIIMFTIGGFAGLLCVMPAWLFWQSTSDPLTVKKKQ